MHSAEEKTLSPTHRERKIRRDNPNFIRTLNQIKISKTEYTEKYNLKKSKILKNWQTKTDRDNNNVTKETYLTKEKLSVSDRTTIW